MKNFFRGIFITIAIEAIIFTVMTFSIHTETTVRYNPSAILQLLPEGFEESTK